MNSQDLSNLQEAYLEVYQLDEEDKTGYGIDTYASKKYFGDKEKQEKLMRRMNRLSGKKQQTQKEEYDLYDIILSHLLDEGYAETQEQAEVIMVNMSEDWRERIMEGMKPLPVGKMAKQAERKAFYHNLDHEPWSYYTDTNRQLRKMSEVGGKKVKKAAEKGRELANDVDNRLYRKYAPPDLHR